MNYLRNLKNKTKHVNILFKHMNMVKKEYNNSKEKTGRRTCQEGAYFRYEEKSVKRRKTPQNANRKDDGICVYVCVVPPELFL